MIILKTSSKPVLAFLILILFLGNYYICDYFYSDNIRKWWELKTNIYAIIIALAFILSSINARGICRFFLNLGVGFAISNVIDRLYFDVRTTTKEDIIMVILTILLATIDYKKPLKQDGRNKSKN
jgi:hypothetical protein